MNTPNAYLTNRTEDPWFIKMQNFGKQHFLRAFFSTALSELNHGVISSLLLMESFRCFRDGVIVRKTKKNIWVQKSYLSSNDILKSIAYHSIETIIIDDKRCPYFWTCLVDDLIESYRPTRAGKDFISLGICEVRIFNISPKKIHIRYNFNKKKNIKHEEKGIKDVIRFFIDKLERYYLILDFKDFEFVIDVKLKRIKTSDNQKSTILMKYEYKKDQKIKKFKIS